MHTLYAAVLETRGYVVGSANAPSGLHRHEDSGSWTHLGWQNVRAFGVAASPEGTLYLAAGNGVFRSTDGGTSWRITTGWRITEVLHVVVDPFDAATVYAATSYGVWRSPDRGDSWTKASNGIPEPSATYTPALVADQSQQGRLIVGSERGLFETTNGAQHWTPTGPRKVAIRDLRQSPATPDLWLAGTEEHGVLLSDDGGASWQNLDDFPGPLFAVALDPHDPRTMAVGGYRTGLLLSDDGGAHWDRVAADAPSIHALAFDPDTPDRLWMGTIEEGVFYLDKDGFTLHNAGLPEATVRELLFVDTNHA